MKGELRARGRPRASLSQSADHGKGFSTCKQQTTGVTPSGEECYLRDTADARQAPERTGSTDEKTSFISDTCETVIAAVEFLGDRDAFCDLK